MTCPGNIFLNIMHFTIVMVLDFFFKYYALYTHSDVVFMRKASQVLFSGIFEIIVL